METRKKMAKIFLLTNFVRREKRWQRFHSLSKDGKIYQVFGVFGVFLGLYRLFRGVGIGWAVFGRTEHWLPRYARLKVGE